MRAIRKTVILAIAPAKERQGGIIIPESARGMTDECEVLMVGPDVKDIQVGDIVLRPEVTVASMRRGKDYDVMIDDRKCLVVDDEDIRLVTVPKARPLDGGLSWPARERIGTGLGTEAYDPKVDTLCKCSVTTLSQPVPVPKTVDHGSLEI